MPITEVAALMGLAFLSPWTWGRWPRRTEWGWRRLMRLPCPPPRHRRHRRPPPRLWTNPIMRNKDGVCRGAFGPRQATFDQ